MFMNLKGNKVYCSACKKFISKSNWALHTKTKKHKDKILIEELKKKSK